MPAALADIPTKKGEQLPQDGSKYDRILRYTLHTSTIVVGIIMLSRKFRKRIQTADHVPAHMFEKKRWIKGKVTS
jgi:hypothetical protein